MPINLWNNLSEDEAVFFKGERQNALERIFSEVANGQFHEANYQHVKSLTESFENQATLRAGGWWIEKMSFLGQQPTPDSKSIFLKVSASELPRSEPEKRDHVFSVSQRYFSQEGFQMFSRSLPVMIRYAHVQDRIGERGTRIGSFVDDNIHTTIAMAVAMCKIVEERSGHLSRKIPVALPAKDGLYLGELTQIDQSWTENRIMIRMPGPGYHGKMTDYKWFPKLRANLWTYIGIKEMRPEQARLQSMLSGFFNPPKSTGLSGIYDDYMAIKSDIGDPWIDMEAFSKSLKSLENIMNGDLWRAAVYSPGQRSLSGLPDFRR